VFDAAVQQAYGGRHHVA
jgi:isocitrate dehydrogenase